MTPSSLKTTKPQLPLSRVRKQAAKLPQALSAWSTKRASVMARHSVHGESEEVLFQDGEGIPRLCFLNQKRSKASALLEELYEKKVVFNRNPEP